MIEDIRLHPGLRQIELIYELARCTHPLSIEHLLNIYEHAMRWIDWEQGERAEEPEDGYAAKNCYIIVETIRHIFKTTPYYLYPEREKQAELEYKLFEVFGQQNEIRAEIALIALESLFLSYKQEKEENYQVFETRFSQHLKERLKKAEKPFFHSLCLQVALSFEHFDLPAIIQQWIDAKPEESRIVVLELILKFGTHALKEKALSMAANNRHFLQCSLWEQVWIIKAYASINENAAELKKIIHSAIHSPYPTVRQQAAKELENLLLNSKEKPEEWLKFLEDEDPFFRRDLIRALTIRHTDQIKKAWLEQLSKETDYAPVQLTLLKSLASFKDSLHEIAKEIFKDPQLPYIVSIEVRIKAIELFLPHLNPEELCKIIFSLLKLKNTEITSAVSYAFKQIDVTHFPKNILKNLEQLNLDLLRYFISHIPIYPMEKEQKREIINRLEESSITNEEKYKLIVLLSLIRDEETTQWLLRELDSYEDKQDKYMLTLILESLSHMGSDAAVKRIIPWLRNETLHDVEKTEIVHSLSNLPLKSSHLKKIYETLRNLKDFHSEFAQELFKIIIKQPWEMNQEIINKISGHEDRDFKKGFVQSLIKNPELSNDKIYYQFLMNNADRDLNTQLLNALDRTGELKISKALARLLETRYRELSPLTSFINQLDNVLDDDNKRYFQEAFSSNVYANFKDSLAEYFLTHPIEDFLSTFFSQKQLADLLRQTRARKVLKQKDEIIAALLRTFNLQSYHEPQGIYFTLRKVDKLIREFSRDSKSIVSTKGTALQVFHEAEKVTRELIFFYASVFFGEEDYLFRLKESWQEGGPVLRAFDLSRLPFGDLRDTLRKLDKRLTRDDRLKKFRGYLVRNRIMDDKLFRLLDEIIPIRNSLAHPSSEGEESSDSMVANYEKGIKKVKEYLELLSRSFKITKQSLDNLTAEGLSGEVLKAMKSLENMEFIDEDKFLTQLKARLGEEQTKRYESLILKHAEHSEGLKIYPDVVSIKRFVQNHYGVKYWVCTMDAPYEPIQKVIISEKMLDLKYTYFIYPNIQEQQNSSLVFSPLLIPKDKYLR